MCDQKELLRNQELSLSHERELLLSEQALLQGMEVADAKLAEYEFHRQPHNRKCSPSLSYVACMNHYVAVTGTRRRFKRRWRSWGASYGRRQALCWPCLNDCRGTLEQCLTSMGCSPVLSGQILRTQSR